MIISIAMGAEYLFYMKSIETHARAFLALIILPIGTVPGDLVSNIKNKEAYRKPKKLPGSPQEGTKKSQRK